ncbi:hypothetical protein PBAC_07300 [Pedobacter glucosidilyticus]|nr:O-antigen polymerase [Pedobacter glucosidilyticus]KHJ39130.1 hypothetical protein PBAC_07300 [Pedobacter glucosidilyticus]
MAKKFYAPIVILMSWLLTTLFFFYYGPYEYQLASPWVFNSYIFFIHVSILLGYIVGQQSYGRKLNIKINYYKFVKLLIRFSIFYTVLMLIITKGGDVGRVGQAIDNPADAYLAGSTKAAPTLFSYLNIIIAPIITLAITNSILIWKRISSLDKLLVIAYIIITILSAVGSSVRSGLVAIILSIFSAYMLGIFKGYFEFNLKYKLFAFIAIISILYGFFTYSANLVENRGTTLIVNPLTGKGPDENFILYRILPEKWNLTVTGLGFYLSHSYYRLNMAMNMPSKGLGFGLTNSYFVMRNISVITGWNGLEDISYGLRMDKESEYGIFGVYWATFYTWAASDFGFIGTIPIVFFISYFFSISLKDSLIDNNPFAITTFCNFFGFIYSFPTVNSLQDGPGLTTVLGIFLIWITTRKKFAYD